MRINTTELDTIEGEEEYMPQATWMEAAEASFKQIRAAGLTTSKSNYTDEEYFKQVDTISGLDKESGVNYEILKTVGVRHLKQYEALYDQGKLADYLGERNTMLAPVTNYFQQVKKNKLNSIGILEERAKGFAAKDYYEAEEVLQRDAPISATMAGAMVGSMTDPVNIGLLPVGGTVLRGTATVLETAGKAALQEMGIAAVAEVPIQFMEHSWKKEVGIDYTVSQAAFNAVMSVGAAGLIRGTGSAMMDLTPSGVKVLEGMNPGLAEDYVALAKRNASSDITEHIDNMSRVESGDDIIIKNPTERTVEIEAQGVQREFDPEPRVTQELVDEGVELEIITGTTPEGEHTFARYSDMEASYEKELSDIAKIKDCIL